MTKRLPRKIRRRRYAVGDMTVTIEAAEPKANGRKAFVWTPEGKASNDRRVAERSAAYRSWVLRTAARFDIFTAKMVRAAMNPDEAPVLPQFPEKPWYTRPQLHVPSHATVLAILDEFVAEGLAESTAMERRERMYLWVDDE